MTSWSDITSGDGARWKLNVDRLHGHLNRCAYLQAWADEARLVRTEDHWLQSWNILADNAEVKWDAGKVATAKARHASRFAGEFNEALGRGGAAAFDRLVALRSAAQGNLYTQKAMFSDAQKINRGAIAAAEKGIGYARGTRDTSIAVIGVLTTVATGGSAAYFIGTGMGVAGKVGAVAQDAKPGERMEKAVWTAGLEVVTLGAGKLIDSGAKVAGILGSREVRVALTVAVEAGTEFTSKRIVDEASMEESLIAAMATLGFSAAAKTDIAKALRANLHERLEGVGEVMRITNANTVMGRKIDFGLDHSVGDRTAATLFGLGMHGARQGVTAASSAALPGRGPVETTAAVRDAPPDRSAAGRWVIDNVMRAAA